MSRLFSLNDRRLIERDISYWERSLSRAFAVLKETKAESDDDIEARAVALGSIAGIALAMHNHYGSGLRDIARDGHVGVIRAGLVAHDSGMAHSRSMAQYAEKRLN